jgi:hypothetical protein
MNPQLSAILAFLVAVVLIGGGISLLHKKPSTINLPPGADAASFQRLCATGQTGAACQFSKDKNWVYFGDTIVPGADASTFQLVDRFYAKDKNHVYYSSHGISMPEIVPGDPATFKNLGGDGLYTLDQGAVYWQNTAIPNADPSTFVEIFVGDIPTVYGKDATTVYHAGSVIQGADPNSFHIIELTTTPTDGSGADGYAADSKTVFYDGGVVPGANPTTFVPPDQVTTINPITPITTSTSTTDTTQTNTYSSGYTTSSTGGFVNLFSGFTLHSTPSGSTNAYFDPNGTLKTP